MERFLVLLVALLISPMTATAASVSPRACVDIFRSLGRTTKVTPDDVARFQKEMSDPIRTLQTLAISNTIIRDVTAVHRPGAYTSATVEVDTKYGTMFLKVYAGLHVDGSAYSQVIQNAMARKGMAPAIQGYLSEAEVTKLIARVPKLRQVIDGEPTSFAILMDRLEPVVNIGGRVDGVLSPVWTKEKLLRRVREFESAMSYLRIIPPMDLQAVIDKQGRFILYDFDGYGHITTDQKVFTSTSPDGVWTYKQFLRDAYQEEIDWAAGAPMDTFYRGTKGEVLVGLGQLRKKLGLSRPNQSVDRPR